MMINSLKLEDIDPEDIEDMLLKIEKSFDIKFESNELIGVKNFGELCDHIANKITLEQSNDCTSQQAFYKLRAAISSELEIESKVITSKQRLDEIFPRQVRRVYVKKIEDRLGFNVNILIPPYWLSFSILTFLLLSLVCVFFNFKIGALGIIIAIVGIRLSSLMANEIELETLGDVAKKITREHYVKSISNPKSFNKKEIENILIDWFSDELYLEKEVLTRDAKLIKG